MRFVKYIEEKQEPWAKLKAKNFANFAILTKIREILYTRNNITFFVQEIKYRRIVSLN